jgi:hypothetical protein
LDIRPKLFFLRSPALGVPLSIRIHRPRGHLRAPSPRDSDRIRNRDSFVPRGTRRRRRLAPSPPVTAQMPPYEKPEARGFDLILWAHGTAGFNMTSCGKTEGRGFNLILWVHGRAGFNMTSCGKTEGRGFNPAESCLASSGVLTPEASKLSFSTSS